MKRLHHELNDEDSLDDIRKLNNEDKAKLCQNYAKEIKQLRRKLRAYNEKLVSSAHIIESSHFKSMKQC